VPDRAYDITTRVAGTLTDLDSGVLESEETVIITIFTAKLGAIILILKLKKGGRIK
jgi:hypothetical protein